MSRALCNFDLKTGRQSDQTGTVIGAQIIPLTCSNGDVPTASGVALVCQQSRCDWDYIKRSVFPFVLLLSFVFIPVFV